MSDKWEKRWRVSSRTSIREYTVALAYDGETWGCSCPHWKFSKHPKPVCKHIREVQNNGDHVSDDFFSEMEFAI